MGLGRFSFISSVYTYIVMNKSINSGDNLEKIKKLYHNEGYFDRYGNSIFLFFVLAIILFIVYTYFQIQTNLQSIRDNWAVERCKPMILPFVGFINKPDDQGIFDFTQQNFDSCLQTILQNIIGFFVAPLNYLVALMTELYLSIINALDQIRIMFLQIRDAIEKLGTDVMTRLMNIIAPILQIIIAFKDMAGKGQAILLTGLFTGLAVYDLLSSFLLNIMNGIIIFLVILMASILTNYGLSFIPFVGGVFLNLAIALFVIFIAVSVPLSLVLFFCAKHMGLRPDNPIPVLCFDRETPIQLVDGSFLEIEHVQVGQELQRQELQRQELQRPNKITAKLKLTTARGVDMYYLYGIFVSGTHLVWYDKEKHFIHVSEHPDRIPFPHYNQPFLYSLNTESKRIHLRGQGSEVIFADWDDCKEDLPPNHLHRENDGGFIGCTPIELLNGNFIPLEMVEPNMRLKGGIEVLGVVVIDGLTVEKQFVFKNPVGKQIVGGAHWIYYDPLTKKKTSTFKDSLRITETLSLSQKQPLLYHLITDKKVFWIENVLFVDYNDCWLSF